MKTWSTRIKDRMKELGLTQEDVAKKMGITRGAITHYLAGRRQPPLSQFSKLALILEVDPSWLQFGTAEKTKNHFETNSEIEKTNQLTKLIPIYSWEQISSLSESKKIDNNQIEEYVPHFYADKSSWYALRVKGDSMTAPLGYGKSFNEGDILIVDPEKPISHGDFVVVLMHGAEEATFKQYVVDGGIRYLKPLNPQYPIIQSDENNWLCGVIIASISFK
jgi:SOS-response transcriptional repressor LexA